MWIFRAIVLIVSLFLLVVFSLVLRVAVSPIYQEFLNGDHILIGQPGLELAIWIGLSLILPLLGFAVLIWAHTAELQQDVGYRRRY